MLHPLHLRWQKTILWDFLFAPFYNSTYISADVDTCLPCFDLLHHGVGPALDLGHRLHHPTQSLLKLNLLKFSVLKILSFKSFRHRLHHPTKCLLKLNLFKLAKYSHKSPCLKDCPQGNHLDFLLSCLSRCRACEQQEEEQAESPHNVTAPLGATHRHKFKQSNKTQPQFGRLT